MADACLHEAVRLPDGKCPVCEKIRYEEMRWPLMRNNITRGDITELRYFLGEYPERLTQGSKVEAFEHAFADWLGCKYAVMVNSGASANLVTMTALRERYGHGEIIVPTITWSSDIASVLRTGFHPVFVDIDPFTLGMNRQEIERKITEKTQAIFVTHVLGFDSFKGEPYSYFNQSRRIPVIEDCCESVGGSLHIGKLGTFGLASNFSFYYAHHMSTIEGGMICTDDAEFYEMCRMLRSHGMVREMSRDSYYFKLDFANSHTELHPEFSFMYAGYNVRSTEINAVLGLSQLRRLDDNIHARSANLITWLHNLDEERFRTKYRVEGSSNYALPLILNGKSPDLMLRVLACLEESGVEYRRGTAGGGNQLRQPYLTRIFGKDYARDYPEAEHVHEYGLYIGNYPDLKSDMIVELCRKLNAL